MTDVLVYWRDYKQNWVRQFAPEKSHYWHTKAKAMGKLQPGDWLWIVTSGDRLRQEAKQAGFLMAIWTVKDVILNPGDDPAYPLDDYRFRVIGDPGQSKPSEGLVPVDDILRPPGRDPALSIGRFLQGPRKLKPDTVRRLRAAASHDPALQRLIGSPT